MGKSCTSAFSDKTVVLCRPEDPRLAQVWDARGGAEQTADGPVMLVIGSEVSDEKCLRLATRFGVSLDTLIAFRQTASAEVKHG